MTTNSTVLLSVEFGTAASFMAEIGVTCEPKMLNFCA